MAIIKSGASSDQATIDPTSKALRVTVYNSDGSYDGLKATYRASTIVPLIVAVTADRAFFIISGSATKTVNIKRIRISGMTLTAVAYLAVNVVRYSTASTGGTSTTLVNTKMDTNDADATAVVKAYTAVPTDGNLVGTVASYRSLWQATVAAAAGLAPEHVFNFGDINQARGLILRGVAQEIALRFPVVLGSAGTIAVDVEWTEE